MKLFSNIHAFGSKTAGPKLTFFFEVLARAIGATFFMLAGNMLAYAPKENVWSSFLTIIFCVVMGYVLVLNDSQRRIARLLRELEAARAGK